MITGIVASTSGILPAFTDEFVGSNGSSLPSKWSNIRGAWSIQSNKAATYSAANTYPLTTFNANTKNVSLRANYGQLAGGWGVAFWVKDSENWWAVVSEKTSSFGCGSDVNNGDGTCYVTPFSYNYDYDCSYTTPVVAASCGPDRSTEIFMNSIAGCGGYDAGGYYCSDALGGYLRGINGCCYYKIIRGAAVYYGLPSGLTCESRCPGPCGPGGALHGTTCYGQYTTCPYINESILQYHPETGGVYVPQTCTGTATGGGNTYAATTYYTTSWKIIKMENGVASEVFTNNLGTTTDSSVGVSWIQVVTNDAGQITATATSSGGSQATQQFTPTSPTRATRHGIILNPVASGTQATTAENLVYSPV